MNDSQVRTTAQHRLSPKAEFRQNLLMLPLGLFLTILIVTHGLSFPPDTPVFIAPFFTKAVILFPVIFCFHVFFKLCVYVWRT